MNASILRQTQIAAIGTRDFIMQRQQRRDFRVDFAVANPLDQANNRVILNFPKVFAFPGLEALCGFRLEKGPAFSWSVMTTPPRLCRYPGAKRFLVATQPKVERTSDKVESSPRLLRARIHFPVRENYSEPAGGLVDKGETTLIAADHLPNFLENGTRTQVFAGFRSCWFSIPGEETQQNPWSVGR